MFQLKYIHKYYRKFIFIYYYETEKIKKKIRETPPCLHKKKIVPICSYELSF